MAIRAFRRAPALLPALALVLLLAPRDASAGERVGASLVNPSGSLGADRAGVLGLLQVELEARGLAAVVLASGGVPEAAEEAQDVPAEAQPADDGLVDRARAAGVGRVYVLTVLTLGSRVVLSLAERSGPALDVTRSQRATAASLEEVETVLPRLVQAVLVQVPVAQTATVDTVTTREAAVWQRKPGQFLWGIGIPFGAVLRWGADFSYGAQVRLAFEMANARVDLNLSSQFNAGREALRYGNFAIEGYWLALQGNISPYVGGGMGYAVMEVGDGIDDLNGGLVFNVRAGVEFFRLYKWRLMYDLGVALPTFRLYGAATRTHYWIPVLSSTLSFLW